MSAPEANPERRISRQASNPPGSQEGHTDQALNPNPEETKPEDRMSPLSQASCPSTRSPASMESRGKSRTYRRKTYGENVRDRGRADGPTNVSYSYQWVRNDGTDDPGIPGAAGGTCPLRDDDEEMTIRVRVRFTDDAGDDEGLLSTEADGVAARTSTGSFWSATMTAAELLSGHGHGNPAGSPGGPLSSRSCGVDGVTQPPSWSKPRTGSTSSSTGKRPSNSPWMSTGPVRSRSTQASSPIPTARYIAGRAPGPAGPRAMPLNSTCKGKSGIRAGIQARGPSSA